ncbi:unnamed protein product, partial [Laminaria digitata]
DAAPIESTAVADDSPETAAVEDEPAVVEAVVVSVATVEPATEDVVETVVTRDIEVEVVEDASCMEEEEVAAVTAPTPAEDVALIEPTPVAEDVTETTAVADTPSVVEAVAE